MGIRNLWLVHPTTAEHLTLSLDEDAHGDTPLSTGAVFRQGEFHSTVAKGDYVIELRRDARYLGGPVSEDVHRGGSSALAVKEDEALAKGFVRIPFSLQGTPECLCSMSPWREWVALADDPGSLPEYWATRGAPAALVERLVPHIERVEAHLEHCVVDFGNERVLVCSRPLHPQLISGVPAPLRTLLSAHAHFETEDFDEGLMAGWNAVAKEVREDLLEHAPFDPESFAFMANEDAFGPTWWMTPQGGLFRYTMDGITQLTDDPATVLVRELIRVVGA